MYIVCAHLHYMIYHIMCISVCQNVVTSFFLFSMNDVNEVLQEEFPQYAHIQFHTADDHFKAVGQCIAAAALPELKK